MHPSQGNPTVARIHPSTAECGSYPSWDSQVQLASVPGQPSAACICLSQVQLASVRAKCSSHLSQPTAAHICPSQVQLASVPAKCSLHLSQPSAAHICPRTAMRGWHMSHSGTVKRRSHPSWDSQVSGWEFFACVNGPNISLFLI